MRRRERLFDWVKQVYKLSRAERKKITGQGGRFAGTMKRRPSELVDPLVDPIDKKEYETRCSKDPTIIRMRMAIGRASWIIRGRRSQIKRVMIKRLKKKVGEDFRAQWKLKEERLIREPQRHFPKPAE